MVVELLQPALVLALPILVALIALRIPGLLVVIYTLG